MKIVRYITSGQEVVHGSQQPDGSILRIEGDIFNDFTVTEEACFASRLLAPIQPSAILAIGLNYRKHAEESGAKIPEFPVLFTKGLGALQHPGEPILLPTHLRSTEVDYECELAVVIGRQGKNIPRENAGKHILGYTCANDVSARDWQKQWGGGQFCRGKSFDTFCPLGPALVTPDEIPDPGALGIRTFLNGRIMQDSTTADMIFDVPAIIEFLSGSTTLYPGTVILTGTPAGVGMARQPPIFLQPGDEVAIEIDRIGRLTNPVRAEP
ncbi:MAG: fumarylacetoacetate hydrolase family protein [Terrimicrobiaceae bacterium]|nr:fumarylacetoacetate hydrolase family protein [Terrimicrobiaceae bacterium]